MDVNKTLSQGDPPTYGRVSRRKRTNDELRWFFYGAVPVVVGGLLLIALAIGATCGSRIIPDILRICPPAPDPTGEPVIPDIVTTPPPPITPIVETTPPTGITPPTAITTPPVLITTPPTDTTPPTAITTPPVLITTPPIEITMIPADITPPTAITTLPPDVVIPTSPPVEEKAVIEAKELSPQVEVVLGVKINPEEATGLDAKWIGGSSETLAGTIAPVTDENQRYVDDHQVVRQAMGIMTLHDTRLTLESIIVIGKGTFQAFPIPQDEYVLACHPTRPNDCVAVTLQGVEYQLNPETVSLAVSDPEVSTPTAFYESGSIKKCFKIFRRKICIRVFR